MEQYHLENEVAVIGVEDDILIKSMQIPEVAPREQWATLFAQVKQDSRLPTATESDFMENEFDKNEWT